MLLQQIAEGDTKAFTKVYDAYYPALVVMVTRIVKINQVAEDITNEVFLNLWQNRLDLHNIQSLNAYLLAACRNRSINALKAMARAQSAVTEIQKHFPEKSIDTETQVLSKDYLSFVKREIANLPPRAKEVFTLCREEGLSYEQAASCLHISRNAVKGHMVASMKKLRSVAKKDLGISFSLLFSCSLPPINFFIANLP